MTDVTPLALNVLSFVSENVHEGLEDLQAARRTILSMGGLAPEERLFLKAALSSRPLMEEFCWRFLPGAPPSRHPTSGAERRAGGQGGQMAHRLGPMPETWG